MQVYGLDINPRAVKISWINLYMNALDEKGQPIYDGEKKTLFDRVEFHESDLLSYIRDNQIELERIVGCIPQVFYQFQLAANFSNFLMLSMANKTSKAICYIWTLLILLRRDSSRMLIILIFFCF